jgi:ATP phosphoribosyltransferase
VDLGLQRVRLLAAAADPHILEQPPPRPLAIATEFPLIADRWATARNLAHICLHTWGSTEAWAPTYADLVVDVVETGETMAANGLSVLDELLVSTTVLIARREQPGHALHHRLVSRLRELVGGARADGVSGDGAGGAPAGQGASAAAGDEGASGAPAGQGAGSPEGG